MYVGGTTKIHAVRWGIVNENIFQVIGINMKWNRCYFKLLRFHFHCVYWLLKYIDTAWRYTFFDFM
jgi:hypothetical protein